jgi:hypothetical protein
MKKSDYFAGQGLSSDNFKVGHKFISQIVGCREVIFNEDSGQKRTPVLDLNNTDQYFRLNVTNWDFIEDSLKESDTDNWIGAYIEVTVETVQFKGKSRKGFRVTKCAFGKNGKPKPEPMPPSDTQFPPQGDGQANEEIEMKIPDGVPF